MVEEGNLCHLNITKSTLIKGAMPQDVYMSLFTGCRQFLCLSNLGSRPQTLILSDLWKDCESGTTENCIVLQPQRVRFLERKPQL